MKNDKTQKPGYEAYWGKLHNFLKTNYYGELKEEWEELNFFEQKDAFNHYLSMIINGNTLNIKDGNEYLEVKSNYISEKINSLVTEDTDCVIELGSGWGRNVISNHILNPDWNMMGGELTDEGVSALNHFINKHELSNIESTYFNWCDVEDFCNFVKDRNYKEIIIYSIHSIEQVSYLEVEQFEKLLNLPFKIKFFHVEPCSWQWDGNRHTHEWNENFKTILDTLEEKGKIKNVNVELDGCKLNIKGSGGDGVSLTYEKV